MLYSYEKLATGFDILGAEEEVGTSFQILIAK